MERIRVSRENPDPVVMARAAGVLASGGLVIFPTDTLYGLAADPRNGDAVARVFEAKTRPAGQALPLIASDLEQVEGFAGVLSPATRRLAERFWPGPLTLIVDAPRGIAAAVHGGTGSVAVRVPDHPVARALAGRFAYPVVATSANRSGDAASHVPDDASAAFEGIADVLLDSGPTTGGEPSSIVDARSGTPVLIRAGAIPFTRVLEAL